ncbi:MAG: neutral/alkaline non-lysosomal ceramidase N-terminal domain-containing protein, partial [Bryobacteraceae bacterium]
MALLAGIARTTINPPLDIPSGMWMAQKHVRGEGLDIDLYATALVLEDGGERVVLLDLDLCFLPDSLCSAIREAASQGAGVPPERILPFCSHSHAGPVVMEFYRGEGEDRVRGYIDSLPHWIAGAVARAAAALTPVHVTAGAGRSDVGVNRDLRVNGRIICGVNPEGIADTEVMVLRIDSTAGRPLACLLNYACHPTVLGPGNRLISPDYPGHARRTVELNTGALCFFLQGAAGDMGPVETFVPHVEVARRLGARLGLEAARVFLTLDPRPVTRQLKNVIASGAPLAEYEEVALDVPPPSLAIRSEAVDLPTRSPFSDVYEHAPRQLAEASAELQRLESEGAGKIEVAAALQRVVRLKLRAGRMERYRGRPSLPVEMHAIRLGDTAIVAMAGEPYCRIAIDLKRGSPFPGKTLVAGYLGGDMMYIPSEEAFGYDSPPMQVDNSPYAPSAAALATAAAG